MYLLTENQIQTLKASVELNQPSLTLSLDLGKTQSQVHIKKNEIIFPDKSKLSLNELNKFKLKPKTIYYVFQNKLFKFYFFSETKQTGYKLIPTKTWPTVTINSTPMHRNTFIDPKQDTRLKIQVIAPIKGVVLDTCTGLGYTAIMASQKADKVLTFEKDENVIEIAKHNPFSEKLFTNKNIILKNKDIFFAIKSLKSNSFDRIIHDPPTLKYAGELYSHEFFNEMYRVLKPNGISYIYVPRPGISKNKKSLEKPFMSRLRKLGFQVIYIEKSQAIQAKKINHNN